MQVTDNLGNPVSGAVVTVNLLGSFSGSLSGPTNAAGTVTLRTTVTARKPSFTACVFSVTGPYPYSPGTEGC